MKIFKKIKIEKEVVDKMYCSFCKKECYGVMTLDSGYGSELDGSFELEICDKCVIELLFPYLEEQLKEKEYDLEYFREIYDERKRKN